MQPLHYTIALNKIDKKIAVKIRLEKEVIDF